MCARACSCGFLVSGQELVSDNYQIYDGIIRVAFTEPIRIGDATYGADVNRAASIDFPFRIQFESQETVCHCKQSLATTIYSTECMPTITVTGQCRCQRIADDAHHQHPVLPLNE
jgi:hypothetical protein